MKKEKTKPGYFDVDEEMKWYKLEDNTMSRYEKKGRTGPNKKKAIYLFDLQGNFIKEIDGADAAAKELNYDVTRIRNAARKNIKLNNHIFHYKKLHDKLNGGAGLSS